MKAFGRNLKVVQLLKRKNLNEKFVCAFCRYFKSVQEENIIFAEKLTALSNEDLIKQIEKLKCENHKLNDLFTTNHNEDRTEEETTFETKTIALQVAYLGWDWDGFQHSGAASKSIEAALTRACLDAGLYPDHDDLKLTGCGRTDSGVSAIAQVVTLNLRTNPRTKSNDEDNHRHNPRNNQHSDNEEVSYSKIFNEFLPADIRVMGWASMSEDFSARFDCIQRSYIYHFPKGDLDLPSMRDGGGRLVGLHDFRNFCKVNLDITKRIGVHGKEPDTPITPFMKCIHEVEIVERGADGSGRLEMCELRIAADGFLWHQIRCIMAVLFLVGRNLEKPEVVDALLNVEKKPGKPSYRMADGYPLVLSGTHFKNLAGWHYDLQTLTELNHHYSQLSSSLSIKSAISAVLFETVQDILSDTIKLELINLLFQRQHDLRKQTSESRCKMPTNWSRLDTSNTREKIETTLNPLQHLDGSKKNGLKSFQHTRESSLNQPFVPYYFDLYSNLYEKNTVTLNQNKTKTVCYKPLLMRKGGLRLEERVEIWRQSVLQQRQQEDTNS